MDTPSDLDLVRSLRSTVCPACGGPKQPRQTFCRQDYFALSKHRRQSLYDPLGSGYAEAVVAAMGLLGRDEFKMPEGP